MKIPRSYYSILALFCIAVICTGIVSAVDQTQTSRTSPAFKGMGDRGFDMTNTTFQQEMLTRFQEQGVDVTGLQAAFQSGNMEDVREWMKEHRQAPAGNPPVDKGRQGFDMTNTTFQQEMLTRFQEQGVDVTGLQAAFQSGNMEDVREWMKEHCPAAGMKSPHNARQASASGTQ